MRVYLPEYYRSLNDAWHIIEWAAEKGGGGWVGRINGIYRAALRIPGITADSEGSSAPRALSHAALYIIEELRKGV